MNKLAIASALTATLTLPSFADGVHAHKMDNAIKSGANEAVHASFDILAAHAHRKGNVVTFHMTTAGKSGAEKPSAHGELAGAPVYAYVWPTSLDPSTVGFEAKTGILALAATSHPDFDDTPLYDENGDGDLANDGDLWHSHWVVMTGNDACGDGALAVRDIADGTTPKLPLTWPGLPIFIDSPGYSPVFDGDEIVVNAPFSQDTDLAGTNYDGVTSALRVNASIHAPLLCVTNVFDVASGNLSLPGELK
ncbi:hypothetical protein [Maritalea porphyrae]|uniref:Uncharacterized protein n=1 Tax=Maritalea porphyrae TaxID=880732 RepID=A0ABQ5UTM4_9HYPH|nr:hypothetical protein [Maritalea porphyrae]GLQ17675.1 hypothetical protein GCM10007879_19240 [Maritalea porphyrae]